MGNSGGKDVEPRSAPPTQAMALKLLYFPLPGRAEMSRQAFVLNGATFDDKKLSQEEWQELKKEIGGQLPRLEYSEAGSTKRLGQSLAILRFAASSGGALKATGLEAARADQWMYNLDDMVFKEFAKTFALPEEERGAARVAIFAEDGAAGKALAKIDAHLAASGGWFAGGKNPTHADLVYFSILNFLTNGEHVPFLKGVPADYLKPFPNLLAHSDRMARLPELQAYYADKEGVHACYKPQGEPAAAPSASTLSNDAPKKLAIVYFGFPGRGEPLRLVAHLRGVEVEDRRLGFGDWPAVKEKTGGQLPMLLLDGDYDGRILHQSYAILRYLASVRGHMDLLPADAMAQARCEEVFMDLEDHMFKFVLQTLALPEDEQEAARAALLAEDGKVTAGLAHFNERCKTDSGFLVGDSLTVADIAVFCCIFGTLACGVLSGFDKDCCKPYSNLMNFQRKIASLPKIKEFYKDAEGPWTALQPAPDA